MSEYQIIENYRDDSQLREAYFEYTETIFPGISFRDWYTRGFWPGEYNPVSMIDQGRIISNISMARMKILLNGGEVSALQLGAVGTLEEYRGQGLSRRILDYILSKYSGSVDFFFLFADEEVYDFYRKLGFRKINQSYFIDNVELPSPNFSARKLDISNPQDFDIIRRLIDNRQDLTAIFGARGYGFVTLWHILNIHPQNLYYLPDEDAIIIKTEKDDTLKIWDIIFSDSFDIVEALPKIIQAEKIRSINYYFPPDLLKFACDRIEPFEDYGLFVSGNFTQLETAFRFPPTAET